MIDLRPVNQFMLASAHPLSDVEDIKAEISGYRCKGEFDLKAAYFQQAISDLDSKRLAVRGVDRILLPRRLPMGAKDSGNQLERSVAEALKLYAGEWKRSSKTEEAERDVQATIYRDNLYVVANSWEDFA